MIEPREAEPRGGHGERRFGHRANRILAGQIGDSNVCDIRQPVPLRSPKGFIAQETRQQEKVSHWLRARCFLQSPFTACGAELAAMRSSNEFVNQTSLNRSSLAPDHKNQQD